MEKKERAARLFLRIKPVKMLMALKNDPKYPTLIAKAVDCTYSHTVKLLELFRKYGLVEFEKKGRIKLIRLTEDGNELVRSVEAAFIKLSKLKE